MGTWELTEESLNLFLSWLDPDREVAGEKYRGLQRRLIVMFDGRGCTRSEELADVALNSFIRRLPALLDSYGDDHNPISYLYTTARHLYSDYVERQPAPLPDDVAQSLPAEDTHDESEEQLHECLEECLGRLDPSSRELVLEYYEGAKQAKIDFRKMLAWRKGIARNALRIRVHRIRRTLEECLDTCLGPTLPSEME
jgi:DNA-directed RNA polymerase specialized sigma24 family protein